MDLNPSAADRAFREEVRSFVRASLPVWPVFRRSTHSARGAPCAQRGGTEAAITRSKFGFPCQTQLLK